MNLYHKILLGIFLGSGVISLIFAGLWEAFRWGIGGTIAGVAAFVCAVSFLCFLIALVGAAMRSGNK